MLPPPDRLEPPYVITRYGNLCDPETCPAQIAQQHDRLAHHYLEQFSKVGVRYWNTPD